MAEDHVDHLLAQWRRERPELELGFLALAARLIRLERFIDREASEYLSPLGLNEGEFNVLAALRRAGPPYELTPTDLYRSLLLSSGAMTNRLDRLEDAELIRRNPDPDDRRRVRVALTDRGRELIDRAMDVHTAHLGDLLGFLSNDDRRAFERLLRDTLAHLEAAREF